MKGKIRKAESGWVVDYVVNSENPNAIFTLKTLSLHPTDVEQIAEWSQIFDSIEGRIANSPEVEFEMSEILTTDADGTSMVKYAKIIYENAR